MMIKTLDKFEETCRDNGLKVTHQRRETYRAVLGGENHPSVEDIFQIVRKRIPTISLDTVYRTVDTFEKLGLVVRLKASNGTFVFDTNLEAHQHLVCRHCGKIADVHWKGLQSLTPPKSTGWSGLELSYVEIKGVCYKCRERA